MITLNKVETTSPSFTQYKSTEVDGYGRNLEESFKTFINLHLDSINHPPILYELETNLYMESHQHKIDANVKKH